MLPYLNIFIAIFTFKPILFIEHPLQFFVTVTFKVSRFNFHIIKEPTPFFIVDQMFPQFPNDSLPADNTLSPYKNPCQ